MVVLAGISSADTVFHMPSGTELDKALTSSGDSSQGCLSTDIFDAARILLQFKRDAVSTAYNTSSGIGVAHDAAPDVAAGEAIPGVGAVWLHQVIGERPAAYRFLQAALGCNCIHAYPSHIDCHAELVQSMSCTFCLSHAPLECMSNSHPVPHFVRRQ